LGQNDFLFSLNITFQVMAVTEVSPGHEDTVGPLLKGPDDKNRIHPAGTHNAYRSDIGRILQSGDACQIGTGIGAPVTKKGNDFWFKLSHFPPLIFYLLI
jgi:hypothetical protein